MEEDTTKTERSRKKPKKRAPRDPAGRRQAIIDAAANLIAREGSSKITNRRVAEEAGVPLGSTTQYFKSIDELRREKMVGAGKQYAPTLYTVLVNPDDDQRLFGYYPTLAGETETYLAAKAADEGLVMDGQPLVRFIVDDGLKHGKFDVIAEPVAAPIIAQLRAEEMQRYGIGGGQAPAGYGAPAPAPGYGAAPAQPYGYGQPAPASPAGGYGAPAPALSLIHI